MLQKFDENRTLNLYGEYNDMSIQSFLKSAEILYDSAKYEEALCLVCIALDACSAKQYPNKRNAERYKSFLKNHFSTICKYGFPGIKSRGIRIKINIPCDTLKTDNSRYVDMEQIIYHVLRCGLVHECNIEKTIQFTDTTTIGNMNGKFYIPKDIIWGLMEAVKEFINPSLTIS